MAFVNTSVSLRKYIINYTPPYTNPIIGIEYNSSTHTWRRIGPDSNEVFPNSNYFDNHPIYSQITPVTIDSCAMVKIPKFYFLYQNSLQDRNTILFGSNFYFLGHCRRPLQ